MNHILRVWLVALLGVSPMSDQDTSLRIHMVGNAGVILSDGATSLLIDLPYESGAFGYMTYRSDQLDPEGSVVVVITHHHRDHFDPRLFRARSDWRIIGPASVVRDLPQSQVILGDSLSVGHFTVVSIATPHTPDHRSYRIRWRGRVLHFVGDTEDATSVPTTPRPDLLFVTPWLSCSLAAVGREEVAHRSIAYHLRPNGSDRLCGGVERSEQGLTMTIEPAGPVQ